jgi:subtilisin-like proprotein convertase family protein
VRLAETWNTLHVAGNEYGVGLSASPNAAIPDNSSIGFSLANFAPLDIDHVELTVNINHTRFSDLTITLISPSGVSSVLASRPAYTDTSLTWTFDSTQFWGETGVGNWSLAISDSVSGGTGRLLSWSLGLYGDVPSANDTYVYTDEFNEMFSRDPAHAAQRATLNDSDGGTDLFDGAALTGNAVIRLDGVSGTIDGHALTITNNVIENAYGGDGNDTLIGSAAANVLYAARGNDRLEGAGGADVLSGGDGNDTLYGGAGNDTLWGGNGLDTASYASESVRIIADIGAGTVSNAGDVDQIASIEMLVGSGFADTLLGGTADDRMTGGAGNDLFVFRPFDAGNDTISDFAAGDRIDVSAFGYASIAEIQAAGGGMDQSGSDVILSLSTGPIASASAHRRRQSRVDVRQSVRLRQPRCLRQYHRGAWLDHTRRFGRELLLRKRRRAGPLAQVSRCECRRRPVRRLDADRRRGGGRRRLRRGVQVRLRRPVHRLAH